MTDDVLRQRAMTDQALGSPVSTLAREPVPAAPPPMKRRVLWLINHSTLRAFEVPLLISLGLEVYTSKLYPRHQTSFRSSSADFSFDRSLTIPGDDLARLNAHDFYQQPLFPSVRSIVNRHFDAAICGFFPGMLREFADRFDGLLLLRAFGLADNESYAAILRRMHMANLLDRFARMGSRFRFAQCYHTIQDAEPDVLRRAAIDLPLGLPEETLGHRDSWTGQRKALLFFCPGINVAPKYYGAIYRDFKRAFGALPHIIAGEQRVPVDDAAVRGFRPRDEVVGWFRECAAMFYHSIERRHLHYHPLEAIVYGMPLVFMRQGYLGLLDPTQPGACDTLDEARHKVERILAGDRALIDAIRTRQARLLDSFMPAHCRDAWKERFVPLLRSPPPRVRRTRRIAVLLTGPYRGGTLAAARNIARMLRLGSEAAGESVDVVLSCFRGEYRVEQEFADLLALGITVRETLWPAVGREAVAHAIALDGGVAVLRYNDYVLPADGAADFLDCDHWLLIGDRTRLPLAPMRPYGVVAHDFAQRYVPGLFGDFHEHGTFATLRGADYVLVTTPATLEDAIQYVGLPRERLILAPMEFDPPPASITRRGDDREAYIVWTTNSSAHKNHLVTLEALEEFLETSDSIRRVVVTGVNSRLLAPDVELPPQFAQAAHLAEVRSFLADRPRLARRIDFRGELPREAFLHAVAGSRYVLHTATYDNGTYAVVEAAWLGVPAVTSDYPAMRYLASRFGLSPQYFHPSSAAQLVAALRAAERDRDALVARLPSRDALAAMSWRSLAQPYWKVVSGLVA
jgi:glycosyltransferase involved in cell wall biosynthesis